MASSHSTPSRTYSTPSRSPPVSRTPSRGLESRVTPFRGFETHVELYVTSPDESSEAPKPLPSSPIIDVTVLSQHPRSPTPVNITKQLTRETPVLGDAHFSRKSELADFEKKKEKYRGKLAKRGLVKDGELNFRDYHPDTYYEMSHRTPSPNLQRTGGRERAPITVPQHKFADVVYAPKYDAVRTRQASSIDFKRQVGRTTPKMRVDTTAILEPGYAFDQTRSRMPVISDMARETERKPWPKTYASFLDYEPNFDLVRSRKRSAKLDTTVNPRNTSIEALIAETDTAVKGLRQDVRVKLGGLKKRSTHDTKVTSSPLKEPPPGAVNNATNQRLKNILHELGLEGTLTKFPQWAPFSSSLLQRFADKKSAAPQT